jgi:putative sigma-54 modulation protein
MKLVIQGKNIEITDAMRDYVEQKILKAVSHFQHLTNEVDVHLSVARNHRISSKQSAEVTLYVDGAVVRAEESSESLYASIDLVANKISRQLRKYKEKRTNHKHSLHGEDHGGVSQRAALDRRYPCAEPQWGAPASGRGGAHEVLCRAPYDGG